MTNTITSSTTTIADTAAAFFEACESGQGWAECARYCTPDATFAAQSEAIAEVTTIEAYSNWMQGLHTLMSDVSYDIEGSGVDAERNCVVVYAIFRGTHSGDGGPLPATGKSTSSDDAYALRFDGEKISSMTKIWHSGLAMQELGWA
jgi:predicted ester cyclase